MYARIKNTIYFITILNYFVSVYEQCSSPAITILPTNRTINVNDAEFAKNISAYIGFDLTFICLFFCTDIVLHTNHSFFKR